MFVDPPSLQAQQSSSCARNSTSLFCDHISMNAHSSSTIQVHASDILNLLALPSSLCSCLGTHTHVHRFGGGDLVDYSVNFAATQNPNGPSVGSTWPQWTASSPTNLAFLDGLFPRVLEADTYRQAAMDLLNSLAVLYPI